ncbi:hypothetical protein [Agromyces laixinhei]|uniref:hypothetical protein n=1 Tax=Agromyces laixinhei TaxID=2585717 RepID=UPI0012ECD0A4|nr:hypothetical protein [Agromyces laixinhei]
MRSLTEWVIELEEDDRHPRVDIVAGTALFWLCSLDEALEERYSADYLGRTNASPTGRVMAGLRFARNAVAHGIVVCAGQRGLAFPIVYPIDYGPNVWKHADEFLARWTPQAKVDREGGLRLASYREHVERRPVGEPLRAAVSWLEEWRPE